MIRFVLTVGLVLARLCSLTAQSFTDSNLPIVIISTDNGFDIPDQPRVLATMKINYAGEGERNYVSDQNNPAKLNYNGKIEIEVRGSSSQALSKKQYGLTTLQADNVSNNNVSLLGMPRENDWVLNGLAFDASCIRDYLSYTLSRKIGQYAPRTHYCEVIINGDYRGLYVLQEKIKADDNRVDIIRIEPQDNGLPELSGGYITKADKITAEDPSAWSVSSYIGINDVNFVHEFPKQANITALQHGYIRNRFDQLGVVAGNASVVNGFPSVIDVPSFIDFMLINELAANVDAYQFSTFFHKDRNGKLRAGPLWDLNLTYGNDLTFWGLDRSKTNTWQFDNGDNIGPRFWRDLFNNPTFRCYLSKRWNVLTQPGEPLNLASLENLIDDIVDTISEAVPREQSRWLTIGDHAAHISNIKTFLSARIAWMTAGLGSFAGCNTIQTPPLVITRIHYHPSTPSGFPDSNDQEFIEITNTGNEPVNLTGIYFSGTGFVYHFITGSVLEGQGVIQLANDTQTFKQRYGFSPYGEFTRNLSNSGQKLTLADGYGNVIDEVAYTDETPWPDADGNGSHLKVIDPLQDNRLSGNWMAVNEPIATTVVGIEENLGQGIELHPNPVEDLLTITSDFTIGEIKIHDVRGKLMDTFRHTSRSSTIDLHSYHRGLYILTLSVKGKTIAKKIVKE